MKLILRNFAISTFSLFVVSQIASGLVFESGFITLALAGVGLTIALLVVRPVINILLLPINLLTFNLFRWISSAIALYLVTLVVSGFKIVGFNFPGYSSPWIAIPALSLEGALSIIAFSIVLSVISAIILWIVR